MDPAKHETVQNDNEQIVVKMKRIGKFLFRVWGDLLDTDFDSG
jgi:hypothetical protein